MHAGDMAWVLPDLVWHLEDLRVGMCYQNYYVARLAVEVRQGRRSRAPAATSCSPATRGATSASRALDDPGDFDATLLRLLVAGSSRTTEHGGFFPPRRCAATRGRCAARRLPRRARPGARTLDPVLDRRSTSRRRRSSTGCSSSRTASRWRTPSRCGCRSWTTTWSTSRARIPARLKHARRRRQARAARGDARAAPGRHPREAASRASARPTTPGTAGPTMDYIRDVLLDPRTLERGWFEPTASSGVLDEHVAGRANHRLLLWSLLCFEWWNRLFVDGEPTDATQRLARRDSAVRRRSPPSTWRRPSSRSSLRPVRARRTHARPRRRRRGERPVILRGPVPIVSIQYAAKADRLRGYRSETLVYRTYRISARGCSTAISAAATLPVVGQLVPYAAFLWALRATTCSCSSSTAACSARRPLGGSSCRCFGSPASGSWRTRTAGTPGWRRGPARCRAGTRTARSLPGEEDRDEATSRAARRVRQRADAISARADLVEDLPRLDGLFRFPIDVDEWGPVPPPGHDVVRVVHAPNHPHYKGTRYIQAAVEQLRAEGEPVELVLVQGCRETRRGGSTSRRTSSSTSSDRRVRAVRDRVHGAR